MYSYLKGSIEAKTKGYIILEVNGIGYKIFMSESAIERLGEVGEIIKIHTYMRVREDDISLYGFNTNEELRMFELLLSVSGVGAKVAISLLANITPSSFALAVINNDVDTIKKLPGIGPKTAQRIILELKDKMEKEENTLAQEKQVKELKTAVKENKDYEEAISALQVLGYTRKEIDTALQNIVDGSSVENIIKEGLKNLSR